MKFHLKNQNGNAICGAVAERPDTFLYNLDQFNSHQAKEYECKKCRAIANKKNLPPHIDEASTSREENGFTPGEWKIVKRDNDLFPYKRLVRSEGKLCAVVEGDTPEEAEANASLICEAKNMYYALKELLDSAEDMNGKLTSYGNPSIERAKAIIQRIENKQQ